MDPKDDPEARIRELERSLSHEAAASELGTTASGGAGRYGYVPPDPSAATYAASPVPPWRRDAPPFGSPAVTDGRPAVAPTGSGYIPSNALSPRRWLAIIVGAITVPVVILVVYGTISARHDDEVAYLETTRHPSLTPRGAAGSGLVPSAVAGEHLNLAGVGVRGEASCSGGDIAINGSSNTYVIRGSCARIQVSGADNTVDLESAEVIDVSGADNEVTFSSGSPTVHKSGSGNVVQRG